MTEEMRVASQVANGYTDVFDFVAKYLSRVYSRQVTDISDTVWCPEWWRHPEAMIRLDAVWQTWEHFRLEGGPGISVWFLDHADKHMAALFDPKGPFKYCSVRNGHKPMLESLKVDVPTGNDRHMLDDPEDPWQKTVETRDL
ncbi:DUF4913 domain-containing protein [Nocardia sp. NPDC058705]|uniref:DUF4913 domain-containing protein n=1 Tax=Nocardia sp. NPDC058705 TaxID=3346609 RepID=UPI003675D3AB